MLGIFMVQLLVLVLLALILYNYTKSRFNQNAAYLVMIFTFTNPLLIRYFIHLTDAPVYLLAIISLLYSFAKIRNHQALYLTDYIAIILISGLVILLRPEGFVAVTIILTTHTFMYNDHLWQTISKNPRIYLISVILFSLFINFLLDHFIEILPSNIPGVAQVKWSLQSINRTSILESIKLILVGNEYRAGFFGAIPFRLGRILYPGLFYLGVVLEISLFGLRKNLDHLSLILFGIILFGITPPTATSAQRYAILNYLPIYYFYVSFSLMYIFWDRIRLFPETYFNIQVVDFKSLKNLKKNILKRKRKYPAFLIVLTLCLSSSVGEVLFYGADLYLTRIEIEADVMNASKYIEGIDGEIILGVHGRWGLLDKFDIKYIELGKRSLISIIEQYNVNWIWIGPGNSGENFPERDRFWYHSNSNQLLFDSKFNTSLSGVDRIASLDSNFGSNIFLIRIISIENLS